MKTSDKYTIRSKKRAFFTVVGLALWALLLCTQVIDWSVSWTLVAFYFLVLLNSYFSIRTFTTITPEHKKLALHAHFSLENFKRVPKHTIIQNCIDIILVILLFLSPLHFNSPIYFVVLTLCMFIVATSKYISLGFFIGFSRLIVKKIKVDTLGIIFCAFALLGIIQGYGRLSATLWVCIFLIANVVVLWWKPLYQIEHHTQH